MQPGTWMTSCPEALRILGIWKKAAVEIQTWARTDDFVRYGRRSFAEKIVSLSPHVEKP